VAQPTGLSVAQAALGMRAVANSNMARAIRAVSVERGQDPRDFVLFAFGGAGPNHACDLAKSVRIGRVVIPPEPGVFTASGMLEAAVEYFFIRSFPRQPGRVDPQDLRETAARLRQEARLELQVEGFASADICFGFELDMRFSGQDSEIPIGFDPDAADLSVDEMNARFRTAYEDTYGYVASDGIETVNLRLRAHWHVAGQGNSLMSKSGGGSSTPVSRREVLFDSEAEPVMTPVYHLTGVSHAIEGPAIFEGADTTFTIPPGVTAEPDPHGNLVVTLND
jgi:N-methylhydantoinase A